MPPMLNPVVTKPNTLPKEPGGVIARTIMSREGMMTPEKSPIRDIIPINATALKSIFATIAVKLRGPADKQAAQQHADRRPQ